MNTAPSQLGNSTHRDLEQVIEPLASYICATEQPTAALNLAVALLLGHVEQTNRAAKARLAAFSRSRLTTIPCCGC